jgi:hypothetical protein
MPRTHEVMVESRVIRFAVRGAKTATLCACRHRLEASPRRELKTIG